MSSRAQQGKRKERKRKHGWLANHVNKADDDESAERDAIHVDATLDLRAWMYTCAQNHRAGTATHYASAPAVRQVKSSQQDPN